MSQLGWEERTVPGIYCLRTLCFLHFPLAMFKNIPLNKEFYLLGIVESKSNFPAPVKSRFECWDCSRSLTAQGGVFGEGWRQKGTVSPFQAWEK
uniref:Uncharacterized protein n=1 Tax=Salvator merianae TaxID=96440 RepID=A0A8D0BDL4_SALMN